VRPGNPKEMRELCFKVFATIDLLPFDFVRGPGLFIGDEISAHVLAKIVEEALKHTYPAIY